MKINTVNPLSQRAFYQAKFVMLITFEKALKVNHLFY